MYTDQSSYNEIREQVYSQDLDNDDIPGGWIQWKGSDICIDLWCECGHNDHHDGGFFYFWQCPKCGQQYAVGQNIKLLPMTFEQAKIMLD